MVHVSCFAAVYGVRVSVFHVGLLLCRGVDGWLADAAGSRMIRGEQRQD